MLMDCIESVIGSCNIMADRTCSFYWLGQKQNVTINPSNNDNQWITAINHEKIKKGP